MAKTILCYRVGRPNSLVRVDKDVYDKDNAEAEERGEDSPWILAEEDAASTAPTYDDLSKAEQKAVDDRQAKRQAVIDGDDEAE